VCLVKLIEQAEVGNLKNIYFNQILTVEDYHPNIAPRDIIVRPKKQDT